MGNTLYSDSLVGKTLEEANQIIKTHKVYLDASNTQCSITELDVYEPDMLHTSDYRVNRLSIEVNKNNVITKIRSIG